MKCEFCNTTEEYAIIPSQSWFFPHGKSNLCYTCATTRADLKQLDEVDRLCQHLNIPFEPNEWLKTYNRHSPEQALRMYLARNLESAYAKLSWREQSDRLIELAELGLQNSTIDDLKPELLSTLQKEWGNLPEPTLTKLEGLYCNSLSDYNVQTTQQKDLLKKMTRLSVMVDEQLEQGMIDKDSIEIYNKLLGNVAKQLDVVSGGKNMTALCELIAFIEMNGFKPNPQIDLPADELDMMEINIMDYLRALVSNDPAIAEAYENRKRLRDVEKT